jgi:RNA polymerase-associated protein CTR9
MDHKSKAKAAWQRSLELVRRSWLKNPPKMLTNSQNPSEWSAQLLLGLEAINASRTQNQSETDKSRAFLEGIKLIEHAFKANNKSAAAANALCEFLLCKGNYTQVENNFSSSFRKPTLKSIRLSNSQNALFNLRTL